MDGKVNMLVKGVRSGFKDLHHMLAISNLSFHSGWTIERSG